MTVLPNGLPKKSKSILTCATLIRLTKTNMKITLGDTIRAAVGSEADSFTVKRIFNDGITNWISLENEKGWKTNVSEANLKVAIAQAVGATELTEIEI